MEFVKSKALKETDSFIPNFGYVPFKYFQYVYLLFILVSFILVVFNDHTIRQPTELPYTL